eukprot:Pgem_evm1s10538
MMMIFKNISIITMVSTFLSIISVESTGVPNCNLKADIAFLLDKSGSISAVKRKECYLGICKNVVVSNLQEGQRNFELMKQFTSDVINQFTINENEANIALSTFNDVYTKHYSLGYDSAEINRQLQTRINYFDRDRNSGTEMTYAIQKIKNTVFEKSTRNDNNMVLKVLVVLTDGVANNPGQAINKATELREEGYIILVVGIGMERSDYYLEALAGSKENVIDIKNFQELTNKVEFLTKKICSVDCKTTDWSEWGECLDGISARSREIITFRQGKGDACPKLKEEQTCSVDCKTTQWSEWGDCIEDTRSRLRNITTSKQGEGNPCPKLKMEEKCVVSIPPSTTTTTTTTTISKSMSSSTLITTSSTPTDSSSSSVVVVNGVENNQNKSTDNTAIIAGAAAGGAVVIIASALAVTYFVKRGNPSKGLGEFPENEVQSNIDGNPLFEANEAEGYNQLHGQAASA